MKDAPQAQMPKPLNQFNSGGGVMDKILDDLSPLLAGIGFGLVICYLAMVFAGDTYQDGYRAHEIEVCMSFGNTKEECQ